jgi:adenosine deaminase
MTLASRCLRSWSCCVVIPLLAFFSWPLLAQNDRAPGNTTARLPADPSVQRGSQGTPGHLPPGSGDARIEHALQIARNNPLDLRALLFDMPKGTDLHNHLFGAVYAESFIRAGVEDQLCVNTSTLSFVKTYQDVEAGIKGKPCGEGSVPAVQAYRDQVLYDALVDAFSMRGYVPSPGVTGHDKFFSTFRKFDGTDPRHLGEYVDEVATRAAKQNEQYIELMHTPDFSQAAALSREIGWQEDLAAFREKLLARGLRESVASARAQLDEMEKVRREREHCGDPKESIACGLQVRYLYQVLRGFPKEQVFAQTLAGFETVAADPRFVGINFVMPEDGFIAMSDYDVQMRMVEFLHRLYPTVHITLHAGEIAARLVPYEGLCCHIRLAVEQAHAERIGHGVDVMWEDRPYELLEEMAKKHVMVEINLTSNDVILGVAGKSHPFPIYRRFGVPVALSSDDEGVSRIDLTNEYVRAVQTYDLHYSDLKQLVRTGLEHSFLPGPSIWQDHDTFKQLNRSCAHEDMRSGAKNSARCAQFLEGSEKAQQQMELERRFHAFESSH